MRLISDSPHASDCGSYPFKSLNARLCAIIRLMPKSVARFDLATACGLIAATRRSCAYTCAGAALWRWRRATDADLYARFNSPHWLPGLSGVEPLSPFASGRSGLSGQSLSALMKRGSDVDYLSARQITQHHSAWLARWHCGCARCLVAR